VIAASAESRYQTLLTITQHIAAHLDLGALIEALRSSLEPLIPFNFLGLSLHHPEERIVELRVLSTNVTPAVPPTVICPEDESPGTLVRGTTNPLYVREVQRETRFPKFHEMLRQNGIHSYCLVPLVAGDRHLGGLSFGSIVPNAYSEDDVELMQAVARQASVAVDNALSHDRLARERDRLALLLEINNAVVAHLDDRSLFQSISSALRERLGVDFLSLTVPNRDGTALERRLMDFPTGSGAVREGVSIPVDGTLAGIAYATGEPQFFSGTELATDKGGAGALLIGDGIRCACVLPLRARQKILGTLNLGARNPDLFRAKDLEWLMQIAGQIAIAFENNCSYKRIEELNAQLATEKLYLEDEIRSTSQFEEIIGESPAIRGILHQIETVAPTDSTVLLFGETGTGKELLARAIHDLSARKSRTFVKLNCAAIPTGLLESELFGHEKGAFTGAIAQRIGRFELANGGTIFLDEVGEIPLELQPKLLRVLQEREFERLGSSRTIRVDARLVAATNLDLAQMVERNQFRADLFYRLNVFPIQVPPLRERQGDIPLLVRYFVQQFARRMNRVIDTISSESMDALVHYAWPGNIRELQNLLERAVILSSGPVLRVPVAELRASPAVAAASVSAVMTLEATERAAILRALKEAGGKVGGGDGAASKLGMKRTTLQARMRKLGITAKVAAD
jgi:formate hydrogenlyase transcriptional activator